MKTSIVIASLFLLSFIKAGAQDYLPLLSGKPHWNVFYETSMCETEVDTFLLRYYLKGDTTINGIEYRKLMLEKGDTAEPEVKSIGGLREEDRKVYYSGEGFLGFYNYEKEVLLYDFSKERFDTIWHEKNYEDSNNFTRVIEVDSVLIGDEYRKKMIVTGRNQYHHPRDYWIEGIGSVRNGLIGHIYTMPTCGYFYWEHVCYEENGEVMYLNPSFSNCYPSNIVSSTLPEKSPAGINIYPNPVTAELHIDCLSYNAERIKVRIINPLGQTIIEQNLHSTHNTFSLPGREGMFIVLILDQTGKIMKTEKIIHQ